MSEDVKTVQVREYQVNTIMVWTSKQDKFGALTLHSYYKLVIEVFYLTKSYAKIHIIIIHDLHNPMT